VIGSHELIVTSGKHIYILFFLKLNTSIFHLDSQTLVYDS
jgi:hypothetical protein